MPVQLDLNWLSLGFRLGQLTDIFRPHDRGDDDPPLVDQLLVKLRLAVCRCVMDSDDQVQKLRIVTSMDAIWEQRYELEFDRGAERPFELIYRELLQFPQILREEADATTSRNWFDIGRLLGQSSGWCLAYFYGYDKAETCWDYRDRIGLVAHLRSLGTSLAGISGLPETEDAGVILSFLNQLPVDAPIMRRYPYRRWGWGFIEDRLEALTAEELCLLPPASGNPSVISDEPQVRVQDEEPAVQKAGQTESPDPENMSRLKPGYLGLIVDVANNRIPITRVGFDGHVDLTQVRLWRLFLKYFEAGERFVTKDELQKAWGEIGRDGTPQPNFANAANSELRKSLKVLEVTVGTKQEMKGQSIKKYPEWRLEDRMHSKVDMDD